MGRETAGADPAREIEFIGPRGPHLFGGAAGSSGGASVVRPVLICFCKWRFSLRLRCGEVRCGVGRGGVGWVGQGGAV